MLNFMWIIESCAPTKEEKIILEIVLDYSILFYDKWYTCIQPPLQSPESVHSESYSPRSSIYATGVSGSYSGYQRSQK